MHLSVVVLSGNTLLALQVKRYEAEADKKLLDKPDLDKYVFAQVLNDCGQVGGWDRWQEGFVLLAGGTN